MVLGHRAGRLMIFLGCRMYNRNSYGGQGWLKGSSEKCLSGVVGLLRSLS